MKFNSINKDMKVVMATGERGKVVGKSSSLTFWEFERIQVQLESGEVKEYSAVMIMREIQ